MKMHHSLTDPIKEVQQQFSNANFVDFRDIKLIKILTFRRNIYDLYHEN